MGAIEIRNTILNKLNAIEDPYMLVKVLDFVETIKSEKSESSSLTEAQLDEIDVRRAKYIAGEGKSYSWQEIKQELIDKHGLQA
ncbi:hypothetical protein [uncultured Algibacter sp.]|uniref:hypothetical protein n=1 Tax=uncultured Algibacter sp. TaxID=298659 RepID=UPI0032171272